MAKTSGLGDNLYVGGYDLSGDIGSLSKISGSVTLLDVTSINESAHERLGGLRDGGIDFMSYFNPALSQEHKVLSALPRTDVIVTYARGTTLGNDSACMTAKQINYDGTRANDGAFTFAISTQANAYGLEWGTQLTAGKRTDTAATDGASVDTTASAAHGFQAYLQVFAFTGTDVTIKVEDSANNSTWADLASGAFTAVTSTTPQAQRIAVADGATVRRYLRISTVTTGGFTSVTFAVTFVKNATTVLF